METHSLVCHPETPAKSVQSVDVQISRSASGQLTATYLTISERGSVSISAPVVPSRRTEELWKTTCFEAFIRREDNAGYYEFNFAPSTAWAAYGFMKYRNGMADAPLDPPRIDVLPDPYRMEMTVVADLGALPGLSPRTPWSVALSAVIEETDGTKSYWALTHPAGKPDFHHPTCFTAFLPAPDIT